MTLKEQIKEKGITQAFIARKLGLNSRKIVNLWLNHPETMPKKRIEEIRKLLK
jgi:transcriptional regulator with XRE-family HTH domain